MRMETYSNMAAASLLLYDCILTIHREVTLIWPSRLNAVKILFFLTRYMAFADVSLVLFYRLKPQVTIRTCEVTYKTAGWFMMFGIVVAETILLVRTWAIWGRGKKLAVALTLVFILAVGPGVAVEDIFLNSIVFAPLSNPKTPGCLIVGGSTIISINFIIIIVFETFVLVLTLIKAIQHFRLAGRQGFLSVLYRDGLLFYAYCLAISLVNVIVVVATPRGLSSTLALIQRVVHSCLTSRILVNLRLATTGASRQYSVVTYASSTMLRPFSLQSPSTILRTIDGLIESRTVVDLPPSTDATET
ncbi:unnamed protein product [Somion occarium]|uniref:DUF6533 domain-containing protein n=1 Tax=Somion occarium TaxID=3059160 RepID=A0ABP1DT57_9APHY